MRVAFFSLVLSLITTLSFSQIKKKDLIGSWYSERSNFIDQDTIKFSRKSKDHLSVRSSCNQVLWHVEKINFIIREDVVCEAAGKVSTYFRKEGFKIKKTDFGPVLELNLGQNSIAKFRVVEQTEFNQKQIKLIRYDELSEQKVYKYVDSLFYQVLQYVPDTISNLQLQVSKITNGDPSIALKLRDGENYNLKPALVINGRFIENTEILKKFYMFETYTISYLTGEKAASLYGYRGLNGIVIVQTSEKRFKSIYLK